MTTPVISARGVSKQYELGGSTPLTNSLREAIVNGFRARFKPTAESSRGRKTFWALDDVSFDVAEGEVVGVVGRNGAGKSTLLKVLSRITHPTRGRIEIHGRAASLLEVGTGFHQELTGRENIYLNGTILGMRKREIDRKLDEIVAFAEIEQFIDTPVKRYSSGMYVRLAFGVAAHLDPEILIVDEVLAVGDAEFQRKCLGKMNAVAQQGRTVLFVSHNMSAVRAICRTGIMLAHGRVVTRGAIDEVVEEYSRHMNSTGDSELTFEVNGTKPQFTSLRLERSQLDYGEHLVLAGEIHSERAMPVAIELEVHDQRGTPLLYSSTAPMGSTLLRIGAGETVPFRVSVGPLPLALGDYTVFPFLIYPWAETYHAPKTPMPFSIVHSDPGASGFEFRQGYGRGAVGTPMRVLEPA